MREESVLCPACGKEWTLPLLDLVRRRGEPLLCDTCAHARVQMLPDAGSIDVKKEHPDEP